MSSGRSSVPGSPYACPPGLSALTIGFSMASGACSPPAAGRRGTSVGGGGSRFALQTRIRRFVGYPTDRPPIEVDPVVNDRVDAADRAPFDSATTRNTPAAGGYQ